MRHQLLHCPSCGSRINATTLPGHGPMPRPPDDGDYAVCFCCGDVGVYMVGPLGVTIREATTVEVAEFAANPANTELVRTLHQYWANHPDPPPPPAVAPS